MDRIELRVCLEFEGLGFRVQGLGPIGCRV